MDVKIAKVSKPLFWTLTLSGLSSLRFLSCLFLQWYMFFIIFVLLVYFYLLEARIVNILIITSLELMKMFCIICRSLIFFSLAFSFLDRF